MSDQPIELTAITKLRHAALWELAKRLGGQSPAAEQCFVSLALFSQWVTLKVAFPQSPILPGWQAERWTRTKDALESLTGQTIKELWPKPLRDLIETKQLLTTVEQTIEVPEHALLAYAEETTNRFRLPPPVVYAEQDELRGAIRDAMLILTPKEQKVLTLRYGLEGEPVHTLEETGALVGVTRERVRQLESRARRKLENPMAANRLAGFLD